jgi:protein-S-isoprenylcysteine O-methyltransferase Ste14
MSTGIFILLMMNLAYIGVLPRVFFRSDGHFNLKWWLTAAPFFLSALFVALQFFGQTQAWYGREWNGLMEALAAVLSVVSIALISLTLGTHRRRLSLWHQQNDAPEEIVTYGAYRYVRHPFYAAFIVALLATVVLCLSPWTIGVCAYGLLMLNYTAAREEKNLQRSRFGTQYKAYVERSGRFLPKWRQATQ